MAMLSFRSSLVLVQLVVNAFSCHEFIMTTFLSNPSIAEDSNVVSIMNGGQATSDDNCGTSSPGLFQGFLT